MSAYPDEPDHFVRWLKGRGVGACAQTFVPRLVYGEYLRELLTAAEAAAPDRLTVINGEVTDVAERGMLELRLADGSSLTADAAVLAVGNLPPHDPPGLEDSLLPPARYQRDPWAPNPAAGLRGSDTVLLLGTGLTMVDVALTLVANGFAGRIVAISRRADQGPRLRSALLDPRRG